MSSLYEYLCRFYTPSEFPALAQQALLWQQSLPLKGKVIYDATPVFRNTMVKYWALQCAGAQVVAGVGDNIPYDPAVCALLPEFGITVAGGGEKLKEYDVVADCAGSSRHIAAKYGYVELTRSGLEYYRQWQKPVFSADSGVLKKLETILGTGEGFLRAMKQLGNDDFHKRKVLIFGGGKVGCGVASYAKRAGAEVVIIDINNITVPNGVDFINAAETSRVETAIAQSWAIVSVTGRAGALVQWAGALANSPALIVNMGVEDEFGPGLPAERVLNNKQPLNFILDEPTHLKYIDATMALDNYGIGLLISGKLKRGLNFPARELERRIADDIKQYGMIADEMEFIVSELY